MNAAVSQGFSNVFLGSGAAHKDATDFNLSLNGIDWWHRRIYTSLSTSGLTWQGEKWWGNEMMHITVAGTDGESDVTWTVDPHYAFTWTWGGSENPLYSGPGDNYYFHLSFASGSDEYKIRTDDGWEWVFHDGAHADAGKLKRIEDPFDNDWAFTYSSGKLTDIVVDVIDGNDHKITYTYFTSGDNNGKLQYIKVYKSTTTTDANLIGKVEYVYHDSGSDDYGTTGDLMKVIISRKGTTDGDGTLSIEETYRYRYYKGTYNSSTNPGTDHQLKYILYPENAKRLNDNVGTPESQTNANWADYANVAYEYDSNGRVRQTAERLPGRGCGCGGGGSAGVTTYTWSVNGSNPDVDTWKLHCVADRADDTRVIFDVNRVYNILTWVVQDQDDGSPDKEMIWHFDYGTGGSSENRLTAIHYPSACSDYDESAPYGVTLRSTDGMIHVIEYSPLQKGFPKKIRVKKGTSGTPDTITEYVRGAGAPNRFPTSIKQYESGSEGDARTTGFTYTFYDGPKYQLKQIDTTHPLVSTSKNGPNVSAVTKQFFDKRTGAARWTLDGEGYVTFHAYDDNTGVEDLTVIDVNTSSLMSAISTNWHGDDHGGLGAESTVPFSRTGGGTTLDIDSSAVIDWLGRTRKSIDAGGIITYHVYKDDETRFYPAWNTLTYVTLLPYSIVLTDKDGRVTDSLTVKTSLTPTKDGTNEPTGAETYANTDLAARTVNIYNLSGSSQSSRRYHLIPGSGDGTRYTNYYQTDYEYDSMGRVEYTIHDVNDESTYDREQVTRSFYDFVGRSIKSAEGVSDNSHDISGGKPTLVTTAEYFFDDPDTDSAPEQGVGDGNLSWVRRWHGTGGSDYNDTNYRYDWRNRRQLTIPPLPPYSLVKHDNLDRVTATGTYSVTTNLDSGDDPAITEHTNRLSLSKTYFDEWGRAYRTELFDDPADSTPADALVSNTYYDRRGRAWANSRPNTGIFFTEYDGAGRRIATMRGTQFDSAKYTGDVPDYPDSDEGIAQRVESTLDDNGNALKVITKELNHDDTDGMKIASGVDYIRTYVYHYYDAAHRLTATANFGTNNSDGWKDNATAPTYDNDGGTAGDQPPTRSDTVLVTSFEFDASGHQVTVTDPKAIVTRSVYDALARITQKEENDGGGASERITSYIYNAQGSSTKITADLSTDQVTEYVYQDAQNSRRVTKIKYPATDTTGGKTLGQPSDETYDRIVFSYHADGTLATRTDQNGTVLTWSYDALRRKTEEEVTTLGTYAGGSGGVDGAVRSFTWTYDNEGRALRVTSHSDAVPDTSSWTDAINQIKHTYNAAGRMIEEEQEYDGAVDGSTLSVEYGYGTDYSTGNFARRNYVTFPNGRKIWFGYTHSDTSGTFQDTINQKFSRVGQIARDNGGSIGDLLAQYDFNGINLQVRRVHDETSGQYGNDTKMDLWHGTTGDYDGLDRFGRIVDMKHTNFVGSAYEMFRVKHGYDRNGNRTYRQNLQYKDQNWGYDYDNLNRLTRGDRGMFDTGAADVAVSNAYESFNMDLLGNFTTGAGGVKVNAATSSVTQPVNETNELTSIDRPNSSGPRAIISEPFSAALGSYWTADKGTWSVSGGSAQVDTLSSGEAILLSDAELQVANIDWGLGTADGKAGVVFGHDGNNSYYALVIRKSGGTNYLELYNVVSGSWGSALASQSYGAAYYSVQVRIKGGEIFAGVWDQVLDPAFVATISYSTSTPVPTGRVGLVADDVDVDFAGISVYDSTARDPKVRRISGLAQTSLSSNKMRVDSRVAQAGLVEFDQFQDDDYMIQTKVVQNAGDAVIWARYSDVNNGYAIKIDAACNIDLDKYLHGERTNLATYDHSSTCYGTTAYVDFKIKLAGSSIKVWADGTLAIDETDSTHPAGGIAFEGYQTDFDDLKVGYDNNSDNDINDAADDLIGDEDFGGTSCTPAHDHAGNLVDDCNFRYAYDAWNRLVKVRSSEDAGATTIQTAAFYPDGRRSFKVVDQNGLNDGTFRYYYDGHKIIEVRDGSGAMVQQFLHGTQYIDELIMVRVKDKGELYVHQDANWNVIGTTDLGGRLVEHTVLNPYGELTINQETGFGDRDGDSDVDSADKGTVGTTCTGTVTGSCRILDLDFDGDYDASDVTRFDSLPQGYMRRAGASASRTDQPFAHQGLLFDLEIGSYQNRARQYDPQKRRFAQRDPLSIHSKITAASFAGPNVYLALENSPLNGIDPQGLFPLFFRCYRANASPVGALSACDLITYMGYFAGNDGCTTLCCDSMAEDNSGYYEPPCRPQTCCSPFAPPLDQCPGKCVAKHEQCRESQLQCSGPFGPPSCPTCPFNGALFNAELTATDVADLDCACYNANDTCLAGECRAETDPCWRDWVSCMRTATCTWDLPAKWPDPGVETAVDRCQSLGFGCP